MRINLAVLLGKAILFMFLYSSIIYCQILWEINTFSGYNFASGSDIVNKSDLLLGLDGEFEYTYEKENRKASLLIRAKPELYGFHDDLKTLRLKARGSYFQRGEKFNWAINLTRQYNLFDDNNFNLHYDIFILNGEAAYFINDNTPFTLNLGYAYQTTKDGFEQNLDLLFLDTKLINRFGYFNIDYGIYIERFNILYGQQVPFALNDSNSGWRFGPQVSLNYLRSWVLKIEYRILSHDSPLTKQLSYDQWIRVLTGKFILDDLSAFILIDYFSRNYELNSNSSNLLPLLYSPIDQENNLYIKVEYDLNETFSVYVRSGYSKENFFVNDLSISGWNVLLGLGISN